MRVHFVRCLALAATGHTFKNTRMAHVNKNKQAYSVYNANIVTPNTHSSVRPLIFQLVVCVIVLMSNGSTTENHLLMSEICFQTKKTNKIVYN